MNYRNQWAEGSHKDPHEELEIFVMNNSIHANYDEIKPALRKPRAIDQEDLLREFIKTRSPHEVLKKCFYNLYEVYQNSSKSPESSLRKFDMQPDNSILVDNLLEDFGFKKKVKPTGFSQIRSEIEQSLESKRPNKIDEAMQDLLKTIFLFYHYTLFKYVKDDPDVHDYEEEKNVNLQEKLKGLHERYQNLRQAIGEYFFLLRDFMKFIKQHYVLSDYCYSHFQRAVPLNKNQIAELGMFTLYRNIVSHPRPETEADWGDNEKKANINFRDMDDTTRNEWKQHWDYVVREYKSQKPFPPEPIMVQRMIAFFKNFLEAMSENEIYPKVIVLRSYNVDEYGIRTITADVDNGETISLTDYNYSDFQNDTFTEFYYHSRTNPTGIEPNLVSKEQLEKWKITPTNNIQNAEEM